jgi:AAA lid domain/ATPase family associated with various cellular activities (AAA)
VTAATVTAVRAAVDRLVAVGARAGVAIDAVSAEAAALSAAASRSAAGAAESWSEVFGAQQGGYAAAVRAGAGFADRPTPVLKDLIGADPDVAGDYAAALADVASASCSLGAPDLGAVAAASVIASAQLAALPLPAQPAAIPTAPALPPAGPTITGPEVVTNPGAAPAAAAAAAAASAVAAEKPAIPEKSLDELLADLDALVGLDEVKTEVRRQAEVLRVAKLRTAAKLRDPAITRHLVFVGNPGTGKTTVARLVAQIYRAVGVLPKGQLIETDRSALVAGYVGQTALKTAEVAKSALGGVLFIDEAYALADDDFGTEAIETLVKAMEDHRDELVVIVAGYPGPMQGFIDANPGLASRFRLTMTFADYTDQQLEQIFTAIVEGSDFTPAEGCLDRLRAILTVTPREPGFGNGRFCRNLFEAAVVRQAWRLRDHQEPTVEQLRELTADDLGEIPDTVHPPETDPAGESLPVEQPSGPATNEAT